jgi:zinc protease
MMRQFFLLLFCFFAIPLSAQTVQEVTSPKGINAWLVEDHSLPIVALSFAWKNGLEGDPVEKQGLSYLASGMLLQGAGADNANVFQKKLQDDAISLDFDANRDAITGSMRSLKEAWPAAAALMKAAIQAPRFDADALERERTQMLSTLRTYQSDPDWLLSRLAFRELFKDHPYGKRTLGTEASIATITGADLKKWQSHLDRSGLVLTATGDITPAELAAFLDDVFAPLPEAAKIEPVADYALATSGMWLLKHPGTQTGIMMIWPGLRRDDPDWYTAEVLNYIWGGGGFSSRLTHEIREKRGLTYGISTGMLEYAHAGLFMLKASTRNEDAEKVLKLVDEQLALIRDKPVTGEELKAAKDYLIGAYPLQLTSTQRVATHYRELQRQDLPMDEQAVRAKAIKVVTVEAVKALAQRLLTAKPAIFLVGAPTGVKPDQIFEKVD